VTVVLAARGSTCSALCYGARGRECSCEACGGVLHGVGRDEAVRIAPVLVAGGRAAVAMLELPLTSAPDGPSAAGASAAAGWIGLLCVKCGRPESVSPCQLPYEVGPVCSACRRAALGLGEGEG